MKDFKVCLVALFNTELSGVRYIHSLLKSKGYDASIIFFKRLNINDGKPPTEKELELFGSLVKRINPDLLGISIGCSTFRNTAAELTQKTRQAVKCPVVWGGVHVTVTADRTLTEHDMLVIGEGEGTMLEICDRLSEGKSIADVRNLWLNRDGEEIKNPVRPPIADLDSLPFHDFTNEAKYFINGDELFEYDPLVKEHDLYQIMTTRGCPFACTYCANSVYHRLYRGMGKIVRTRSVENVIEELEYANKMLPDIKQVAFYDDVFGLDLEWTKEFCEQYKKKIRIPYWVYVHPKTVTEELIRMLKESGLFYADMGIQSGSQRVRNQFFKRMDKTEDIQRAMSILNKLKVKPRLDFIMDNPFEESEDKQEMLDLLLSFRRPFEFRLYSLAYFPGVELTQMALDRGYIREENVEDVACKTMTQWFVSSDFERSKEDVFFNSLVSLTGKSFVPRFFIRFLSKLTFLKRFPFPLVVLSTVANLIRFFWTGIKLALKGEVSFAMVRKHLKFVFTVNR
ncbi:MAG: radical SAM protein [Candidatus Coatesbacteria bacterium]|nr:radical SAM protein [Candidatus Coatesbacteria bacterium]